MDFLKYLFQEISEEKYKSRITKIGSCYTSGHALCSEVVNTWACLQTSLNGTRSGALFRRRSSGTSRSRSPSVFRSPQSPDQRQEHREGNQQPRRGQVADRSNRIHTRPQNPHAAARTAGAATGRGEIAATVHCCRRKGKGKGRGRKGLVEVAWGWEGARGID